MDRAQALTLEGVMASLLLLLVMYTFFQSSLVVSPMWSELTDAQLRLLAHDALKVLENNTKVKIDGKYRYLNDSLQGMITTLGYRFEPNDEFKSVLGRLVFPANYRVELCWVENEKINCSTLIPNSPTPEAVMSTRYLSIPKSELLGSVFSKPEIYTLLYDPVIFEVRLTLWRP